MQPPKYDTLSADLKRSFDAMMDSPEEFARKYPNLTKQPRKARYLIQTGQGTLRHQYETPRAVRRRLGLSARQYKKRLKAHKRTGYLPQAFMRRQVG